MRPEHEAAPAIPRPLPELEAEREVDLGRYAQKVLARWWLVAAAIALGALAGYLTSVGGGEVYQAKTTVYLGQPLSPAGGAQIQSLATNPATVNQIVRSEAVVRRVAGEVGVDPARLRRGISTKAVVAPGDAARRTLQNPLVEISVRGPWRRESAQAANLLAAAVVEEVSGYVDVKIDALEEQLANQNRELSSIERRLRALEGAIERGNLSSVERLQLLSLAGFAEQRRGQLLDERTETRQLITLAQTVERSTPITEAAAQKVPAKSRRSSIVVGALIGLLAGIALALLWERLAALVPRPS
jgi:uncharacterized protein involved in exopolysaccharide biosynthesis